MSKSCCETGPKKKRIDWFLWATVMVLSVSYFAWFFASKEIGEIEYLSVFSESVFELLNKMAWGMLLGIFFVGLLERVSRDLVASVMGKGGTFSGIIRATLAGVFLDLCSHGILLVGMKLYQRGLSLGQTMAFLIASPWNSLSLTFILWSLVGLKWTLAFLFLSILIAIVSGVIFDRLVKWKVLPENQNSIDLPKDYSVRKELKKALSWRHMHPKFITALLWEGLKGSKMILRWIFFGTILASLIRAFVPPESFETLFGPTIGGLGLTLLVATILEVCSEGSTPVAADILTRAKAPGNAFGFLMTGVSTDYTEMLALKEATGKWKIAFFLPLVTIPQIIMMAMFMNYYGAVPPIEITESPQTPIYVTFAGHIEDSKMYTDCEVYHQKSEDLLKVAEMVQESGVDINLQASYEWFMGADSCDSDDLMNRLVEDYDFEIDVHQEGASEELDDVTSGNNLADIRFIAEQVTDYITDSTGFQWDNPAQYDRFQDGEAGRLHDFTWYPTTLSGGVSVDHTNGDFSRDMTSLGVWIPSGFTKKSFHIHDQSEEARMVYVGSGPNQFMDDWGSGRNCHFTSSADFVDTLSDYVEEDKIYTYTVFVPQKIMFEASGREQLQSLIDEFVVLAESGFVEFAHHTEVVDIWHTEYQSEPNIFTYDQIDPKDYSCSKS